MLSRLSANKIMQHVEVILTADGSHSIVNTALNETYHSRHGALQESVHVFINSGLKHLLENNRLEEIKILEVGFGTGLNALLTLEQALHLKSKFHYTSLEGFPLTQDIWKQLNYSEHSAELKVYFNKLHETDWGADQPILSNFILHKKQSLIQEVDLPQNHFDLVYFDAFAPSKQPEMWTSEVLKKVYDAMAPGALFVTYCAKGQLKRDLGSLNLTVETIAGPPGKKEMVRALKRK